MRPTVTPARLALLALPLTAALCCRPQEGLEPLGLAPDQLLHSWRLERVQQDAQVYKGAALPERYTVRFQADSTFQKQLAAAPYTLTSGTWQLTDNGRRLHLVDAQGTSRTFYLRVNWLPTAATPDSIYLLQTGIRTEELTFSLIP